MTHVAWKNHANGALNPRAQFRREVSKEAIERSPAVAGDSACSTAPEWPTAPPPRS